MNLDLYDALVDHMRAAVLVEDPEGRIARVNVAFCRLFGIEAPPETLEGAVCADAARASAPLFADPEAFLRRIDALLAAKARVFGEQVELRDGRVLERDYIPLCEGARSLGTLWQYVDVTDQRRAQDALQESKNLAERANEAKTELLATLSHEIRTPLNAMLGMTTLALGTRLDEEQRNLLRGLRTNSEALIHLLSDILDLTGMETGRIELDRVAFDLGTVVEEVAEVLAVRAASKSLELVVDVDPDLPGRVLGDPHRTRQVLMNLVGNAIKYTRRGQVLVSARRRGGGSDTVDVRLEVEDTGPGMAPETLRRVFERFYRGQLGTTEGVGLGLAISRQLVELMGGALEAHSQVGVGSRFFADLRWPIARADNAEREAAQQRLGRLRASVEHPVEAARSALERMLRSAGVLLVEPGAPDAVRIVDERRYDPARHARGRVVLLRSIGASVGEARPGLERVSKPATRQSLWQALLRLEGDDADPQQTIDLMPLAAGSRRTILLVEDNVDNQSVVVRLLERVGHRVEVAESGRASLEALAARDFDLVLLDVDLPDISGLDVVAEIRAREGRRVPVLAFTAHASEQMRAACLSAGMDAFLAKPVAPRTLLDSVAHWLTSAPRRALVADDSPESRMLLTRYLDGVGLEIVEVDRGRDALDRALEGDIDVALLDVEMPGLSGLEVLERLRAEPRTAELPVVLVTGHDASTLKARGFADPRTSHIVKPVRRRQVVDTVCAMLDDAASIGAAAPVPPKLDEDVRALLPGYLRRALTDLDEVRRNLIDGDCEVARRAGHRLKGSGGSYGLPRITELGAELEAAGRAKDADTALRVVGELRALVEPLMSTLG